MPGLAGTTLGRYHLTQRLGRGGMSEVYLGHDEMMNRDVAVKVVSSTHAEYIERFHREAEAIGRLNHDHILPAYDYGEQEPWHYLVMPYIEYGTLRDRLMQGPLSLEEAGELITQIASGLQFAHDQGIIHRDIKPSNILLRDDMYAYIADFGLAKSLEGGDTVTLSGALLGTPEYMAPELTKGPATTSSDIYALGILLYQMVTGQVPFSAETPIAVYWKQLQDEPPPPSMFNASIPPAVERVILRALEKNPRRRYQTAEALASAYNRALTTPSYEEAMPVYEEAAYEASNDLPYGTPQFDAPYSPHSPHAPYDPRMTPRGGRMILPGDPAAIPSAAQPVRRRLIRRTSGPTPNLNRVRTRAKRMRGQPLPSDLDPLTPIPMRQPVMTEPEMSAVAGATDAPISAQPAQPLRRRTVRRTRTGSVPVQKRKRRFSPVTVAALIGVGLLLVISIPFFLFYNQASKQIQIEAATANAQATANVRNSSVQATQQVQQSQASATAGVAVTATHGPLILSDPLTANTGGRWQTGTTACAFTGGSYHVYATQANFLQSCESTDVPLINFALQVNTSLLSGDDAGVILRVNGTQFYDFEITRQGQFFFRRHDSNNGYVMLIDRTNSSAIAPVGQKNTLLVIASGNDFKLYINGTFVGEQQDSTSTNTGGQIGFVVGTLTATSAEASFSNLNIYHI